MEYEHNYNDECVTRGFNLIIGYRIKERECMLLSVFSVVMMTLMFLYMMNKAHFAPTRRMSLIPLACAAIELFTTGLLTPVLFPVLTAVLVVLRAVILLSCFFALRQDAAAYSRRRRKAIARSVSAPHTTPYKVCTVSGRCA